MISENRFSHFIEENHMKTTAPKMLLVVLNTRLEFAELVELTFRLFVN